MTRPRIRRRAAGFTLIELMVVLAILGLLLALLPDALGVAIPGQQLRAGAYQLADVLKDARARAVVSGEPISVPIVLNSAGRLEGGDKRLPRDTSIRLEGDKRPAAGRDSVDIRFFPDGSASGERVVLSAGGRTYVINVDWLTGRVDVDG